MMANQGVLVSNEINAKRARVLAENVERTGARNVVVLNERPDHLRRSYQDTSIKLLLMPRVPGRECFGRIPQR